MGKGAGEIVIIHCKGGVGYLGVEGDDLEGTEVSRSLLKEN